VVEYATVLLIVVAVVDLVAAIHWPGMISMLLDQITGGLSAIRRVDPASGIHARPPEEPMLPHLGRLRPQLVLGVELLPDRSAVATARAHSA
jgi:hypothetical protein